MIIDRQHFNKQYLPYLKLHMQKKAVKLFNKIYLFIKQNTDFYSTLVKLSK